MYITGHANLGADILLRLGLRAEEWQLHPQVEESIWQRYSRAEMDLFASEETTYCPLWFALTHPATFRVLDAMVQTWLRLRLRLYAFPPDRSAPVSSDESLSGGVMANISSPILPGWFSTEVLTKASFS